MLVVFSLIFVADTKVIFGYNFVVPLKLYALTRCTKFMGTEKNV